MFKKLLIGAALLFLYRFITKPWKETPFYAAGIIDENGKMLYTDSSTMTNEQKAVYTKLAVLSYELRKLLNMFPLMRFQLIGVLLKVLFMKESIESSESNFIMVRYNGILGLIKESESIKEHTVYLETGDVLSVGLNYKFDDVYIFGEDVTNTTDALEARQADTSPVWVGIRAADERLGDLYGFDRDRKSKPSKRKYQISKFDEA